MYVPYHEITSMSIILVSFGEGQIHWMILMGVLYVGGATFYATRFPGIINFYSLD